MYLAIECGGTGSVVVYVDKSDVTQDQQVKLKQIHRFHFGPANFKLLKPIELEKFFQNVRHTTKSDNKPITALAVGMPGVLTDGDRKSLKNTLLRVWQNCDQTWVGNDLETALARLPLKDYLIRVVAISGTGSCCYGTDGVNKIKIGGYGHIIGDRGSGYSIAHRALRIALCDFEHNYDAREAYVNVNGISDNGRAESGSPEERDKSASSLPLLKLILLHLNLVSVYELTSWSLVANKTEIADIARVVIEAAQSGNQVANFVVEEAINEIVNDIIALIRKLKNCRNIEDNKICIGLTGSVFTRNQKFYTNIAIKRLRKQNCFAEIVIFNDTVLGALRLILDSNNIKLEDSVTIRNANTNVSSSTNNEESISLPDEINDDSSLTNDPLSGTELKNIILPICNGLSDTEQRNIRSWTLSSMPIAEAVELMIDEEARANRSLREHVSSFTTLIEKITEAFRCGGRLIYVGAGTSGRLGILDASECPPTFKTPRHWVQGIIAGGTKAIQSSIESAEDSIEDGIISISEKDISDKDVVLGIAASGKTPFVWGALYEATQRGAYCCLLTFNQNLESRLKLDMIISVKTGPEVLTGSTRLKAGTATKCVLNMLTTLSMVKYGKCLENLMVDLMPMNEKLRDRALRITMLIVNDPILTADEVKSILIKNNYDIKKSVTELRKTVTTVVEPSQIN